MRYLLKIFSGPHVGAEVLLSDGETVIGSGDDCEVVLDDRLIAERHACVSIAEDAIECRPLGENTLLVDGKPVGKTAIRPFQYFTIGTTHLAVGPADKPWPHFDLSDFQLRAPVQEEEDSSESDRPENEAEQEEGADQKPASAHSPHGRSKFAVRAGAALASVLIILNSLLLVFFFNGFGSGEDAAAAERDSAESQLQQIVARYAPHVVVQRVNERWQLTGYVDDEQDREDLLRAAREADPNAVVKVRSTQSLLASVRKLLKKDGWETQLHATDAGPGVVRIVGALPLDVRDVFRRWKTTENRIEEDIPLKRLVVELEESQVQRESEAGWADGPLRSPVPRPRSLFGMHGNALPILDVRVAHDRVFTLPGGRQVSAGGWLPDGSRVEKIDLDHAVVRTMSGQRLVIPYGIGE